jgi:hypothetical protein
MNVLFLDGLDGRVPLPPRKPLLLSFAAAVFLAVCVSSARAGEGTLVNLAPAKALPLMDGAKLAGVRLVTASPGDFDARGQVVIWEASGGSGDMPPEVATRLGEWVRKGGRLLVTLSDDPRIVPMRLAFLLPTTAWRTQAQARDATRKTGGTTVAEGDPEMFPRGVRLKLPLFYPLRPFDAVERGEGRYERFARLIPYIDVTVPAGHTFWTRPLINRDWRVRARANDVGRAPMLLTGRYGAGRVAVFGASVAAAGSDAQPFWADVLRWLTADDAPSSAAAPPLPAPVWEADAARRLLRVAVHNPGTEPRTVHILARLRTWERAIVGDVERELTVPPGGQAVAELPLPEPGVSSYQAIDFRDAWDVRLGVLSGDGSVLLYETCAPVDLRPPLLLSVATDNLRSLPYPFYAPGLQTPTFANRMGMEVDAYAYQPGQTVNVGVTIANGVRNIAPLATVRDETQPANPSTMALNDEAAHAEQGSGTDGIEACGSWTGLPNRENVLSFTFPSPVTIAAVTLVGSPDNFRFYLAHNPGAAVIEADGEAVAGAQDLDARFVGQCGAVSLPFSPRQATVIRVRLPWGDRAVPSAEGERRRAAPWLGEVRIDGSAAPLPGAQRGTLSVVLRDAMSGASTPVGRRELEVAPGATLQVPLSVVLPGGSAPRFYRIEASFAGREASAPLMVIAPAHALQPLRDLKPATAPDLGFIVTRGFRNVFDTGTGTAELTASWGTPDDLVWAYSRQMKQLGRNARTQANRLYVSESDMRHYSTPWRSFPDGEYFYDLAPPLLVERMKQDRRWAASPVAILSHSDRWDCAPDVDALHGWQDFIGFDDYLRASGQPGLAGRTRKEIAAEIHGKYEHRWQAWHLARYVRAIHDLKEAFAREGKRLVLTAQGSTLVPGPVEAEIAEVLRGQSDDSTWGMIEESVPLTSGRQMGVMAFNPGWAMATLLQWGFNSAVLNNPHWHNPVGTTEPSRRHLYDRAWRGIIGRDGVYRSMHTYGYNSNAGLAYTMTENDWQQWWRVQERHSLIAPEGPIGAGLVISTARFADPDRASFSGNGGWGSSEADDQARAVARVVRRLQEAGVSVPFSANAAVLDKWSGAAPLILLDVDLFSEAELASVRKLKARGVQLAAFTSKAGGNLAGAAAELFGVLPAGAPGAGTRACEVAGQPLIVTPGTLFLATPAEDLTTEQAQALAVAMKQWTALPITFPAGTAGYGFMSQGLSFVVVEDWLEEGRTVALRLRAGAGATAARAVDVNDHRPLTVRRDGDDWVMDLPVRPGDGTLVAIEESK